VTEMFSFGYWFARLQQKDTGRNKAQQESQPEPIVNTMVLSPGDVSG
ncbi:uncharacterized protein METZ01_LOCUS142542, partial [marine metagenome]